MIKRFIFCFIMLIGSAIAEPLDKVVAVVNEEVITKTELENQAELAKKQMAAKKVAMPDQATLYTQVLQHLIDVKLQLQLAKANHISIDDTDLNNAIKKIASANHITLSQLRQEITQQGVSWKAYREDVRKEMLISQLQQKAVGKSVQLTPKQVEAFLKKLKKGKAANQSYHVVNIIVPIDERADKKQLKLAQQKAYQILAKAKQGLSLQTLAKTESDAYFQLESIDLGDRKLKDLPDVYVEQIKKLKAGEIAGPIKAGNGLQVIKLEGISGENGNGRHKITTSHTRHILIKQSPGTSAEETKKQAQNLYRQIKGGKDFATLAKKYSYDAISAKKGGDLGWVKPGETVPEFETAMNELKLNSVSEPVKSPFGWHLIQVLERKEIDDSEAFERQQATQMLHQQKFYEALQNWQLQMRNDAFIQVFEKEIG